MRKTQITNIVKEYRRGLKGIFQAQLVKVLLYGSCARGEECEHSDIDILCVLRGSFDYHDVIRRSSKLTAEISLRHDVVLSRVFVSEKDFLARRLPFYMNVRREGALV